MKSDQKIVLANAILLTTAFAAGLLLGALALGNNGSLIDSAEPTPNTNPSPPTTPSPTNAVVLRRVPAPRLPQGNAGSEEGSEAQKDPVAAQVEANTRRWRNLENELTLLRQRVAQLEHSLASAQAANVTTISPAENPATPVPKPAEDIPDRRRNALIAAGVDVDWAADIVWRESQREMERLEIRDQALREGWFRTKRYFDELSEFSGNDKGFRTEISDDAYDRYLHSMGEPNRVVVDSVIQGSPAQQAGILPGDVILDYAGQRTFSSSDLRNATADGERGETVRVRIQRGEDSLDLYLPRGPMGTRLDTLSAQPSE